MNTVDCSMEEMFNNENKLLLNEVAINLFFSKWVNGDWLEKTNLEEE